jgi:hypothetical protein
MKDREAKQRIRFIKEAERFLRRIHSYALNRLSQWNGFRALAEDGLLKLSKLDRPRFYNPYYAEMIRIIDEIGLRSAESNGDLSDLASWLTRELNRNAKTRRQKSYNRAQHRGAED